MRSTIDTAAAGGMEDVLHAFLPQLKEWESAEMNIDPTLDTIENLLVHVTNPALGQPTNPDQIGVTVPVPWDPASLGFFLGPGLNLDGDSSNTQVIVYLRPSIEDVAADGVNQVLIYERAALSVAANANAVADVSAQMSQADLLDVVALALGVVPDAITFVTPPDGQPDSIKVDAVDSALYLPGAVSVTLNWS
jgi:hypothetical protein